MRFSRFLLPCLLACTVASAPAEFAQSRGAKVTKVTVSPNPMALEPGDLGAATCTPANGKGTALKTTCRWVSSDPTVASVTTTATQAMTVTARKVGIAQITVTVTGTSVRTSLAVTVSDTAAPVDTTPPPPPPPDTNHAGPQVTTAAQLQGAFAGTLGQPGDTVWLRAGSYKVGTLTVTAAGRVFRQWPGERAVLDGILQVKAADVTLSDWELANTSTALNPGSCIDLHGARAKVVGVTVHDCGGNGIGVWSDAPNAEVVGTVLYNNGWNSPAGGGGYGHGIYVQSTAPNTVTLRDNAIYDNFAFGIHGYTEGGSLSGIQMVGNAVWNSGVPGPREPLPNLFVGSSTQSANRILIRGNHLFVSPAFVGSGNRSAEFGYGSQNADVIVDSNVIVNGNVPLHLNRWAAATVRGNRMVSSTGALIVDGAHTGWTWSGNEWGHSATDAAWRMDGVARTFASWQSAAGASTDQAITASGQWVTVRPNPYEPGRGLIIVENWSGAATVGVDLSRIAQGKPVGVRHAQAPFGVVLASGTGLVTLPTANVVPPTPLPGWSKPVPVIGPAFAVYLVTPN